MSKAPTPIKVRIEVEYEDELVRREAVYDADTGKRIGTNETDKTGGMPA